MEYVTSGAMSQPNHDHDHGPDQSFLHLIETRLDEPSMSTVDSRKRLRAAGESPPASIRTCTSTSGRSQVRSWMVPLWASISTVPEALSGSVLSKFLVSAA